MSTSKPTKTATKSSTSTKTSTSSKSTSGAKTAAAPAAPRRFGAASTSSGAKTGAPAAPRRFGAAKPAPKAPAKKSGTANKDGAAASKAEPEPAADTGRTELFEKTIPLTELANVVLNDSGDEIRNAKKSPLVIDPAGQAEVFFRYRNVNNLDALSSADMQPERIRLAVIGGIRYGKPVVVTIETADLFDTVTERLEEVHKGLTDMLLNTSILDNEQFMVLVKESDGEDYKVFNFNESFTQHFRFVVLTKDENPPSKLLEKFYVVRIQQK